MFVLITENYFRVKQFLKACNVEVNEGRGVQICSNNQGAVWFLVVQHLERKAGLIETLPTDKIRV